ncbi:hypothetical protein LINPERHAP2_LOCUS31417 [Linum perenne]
MVALSDKSLIYLEDLSFPSIQIVVVTASMACSQCRRRVSLLLSRMAAGLIEYTVDVRGKQVVFKGETEFRSGKNCISDEKKKERRYSLKLFLSSFFLLTCCFLNQKQ